MDLFETDPAPSNGPEFTVSELSGAVKKVIEGEFGLVRVRGEVGRLSRPASGHLYFALKDDKASLDAVSWKGQVARMQVRPEEGMEVIATGRMTTFPGQSKYQLIVEDLFPAGAGALMAMLEKRRAALSAEGLFDQTRKKPIPYLPEVIGVVTSPSGAVIRDILHRLADRFPRHVLIWPVAVQGQACASEVAAAIRGFNAIEPGGNVRRPDVIIVARGGGSLEDLWGFNEEIVVRAAAASNIPLISAVGHETDTTLIDYAADLRAPTPTAAAELAVPVRLELLATNEALGARLIRSVVMGLGRRAERLRDLGRALPRPESLVQGPGQRLDLWSGKLGSALGLGVARKRGVFESRAGVLRPQTLLSLIERRRQALERANVTMAARLARRMDSSKAGLDKWASRLAPALSRLVNDAVRRGVEGRIKLGDLSARVDSAPAKRLAELDRRLEALDRTRLTLGYAETLKRGYAVVRGQGVVLTNRAAAETAQSLEIEFHDGRVNVGHAASTLASTGGAGTGAVKRPKTPSGPGQGSLF